MDNQTDDNNTGENDATTPTPPDVGAVIAPSESAPQTPAAPDVNSTVTSAGTPKKSKRWLSVLVALLILCGAGYAVYYYTKPTATVTVVTKHDVPLLRVGVTYVTSSSIYPNIPEDDVVLIDENHQMFEGLTGFTGDGTRVVPLLAKSWTNPNSTTWVFALQHGVKFHDGNLMTSKQVVASINQVLPTDVGQTWGVNIASVTAVDDYTVKITTTTPDTLLPAKLTYLNVFDTDSAKKNDPSNGTGPYILKPGTQSTDSSLDLVAFPGYWGGHVYTREVQYKAYSDPDAIVAALNKHQIDMGTPLNGQQGKLTPNSFNITEIPPGGVAELVPNNLNGGPIANAKVRQALWLALDPVALAKAYPIEATPVSQIVLPSIPGYDPSLTRPATDPATAKQMLAAAGYPNGFSFKFTYYSPILDNFATEMQKELKAIGVTVVLDPETDVQQLQMIAGKGSTDMYEVTESSDFVDGADIMSTFVQSPMYDNPQLDALYTKSVQTFDPTKRLAILQEMSRVAYDDKSSLPIYTPIFLMAITNQYNLHLSYNSLAGGPGVVFYQTYSTK